jgi:CheY-like chemotaxis protein
LETCEILIVEDDQDTRDVWSRDVKDFNRTPDAPLEFNITFAFNKQQALSLLSRTRFDCAVIDLRLPDGDAEKVAVQPLGNEVLQELLIQVGIPAVVYSAFDGEASESIRSSNIRVHSKRGGEGAKILALFAAQADLMTAMEATRSRIAKETALLFHRSIWHRWETRWSREADKTIISEVIARQTVSHIADALGQIPLNFHPDEFYVVPALHIERIDTGDLIDLDGLAHVVLTPRCNMANSPPSHILLAVCSEMPEWAEWKGHLLAGNAKQKDRAAKDLRNHATQGHGIATHFLPPLNDLGPWLVNFQEVRTMKSEDMATLLPKRFASVAPHFVPNLVQRYSSYLGRIGQPNISTDILSELCQR